MNRIARLSPRVAEQIAAGEVIERPASVVKELVENSLDAGATEIAVTLREGGRELIEVLDNGSGIEASDLPLAIERHATSKIAEMSDLEALHTMGFRGEALASIGAVSALQILSRTREAGSPHEIRLDHSTRELADARPEAVTFGHFLGSPHGTRIRVESLFSQIPARLKFLKSPSAELTQVRDILERLALAHPKTGFKLQADDRTLLQLRPQDEESRIRQILADGEDYPIRHAELSRPGLKLRAYWVQGLSLPHTRSLMQFVNGRTLRDRVLQQALLQPFRQSLLPGKFPALVAYLDLDPCDMDVNVHPTKSEIRFLDSRKIFTALDEALGGLIHQHGAIAWVGGEGPQSPAASSLFSAAASGDVPHFSPRHEEQPGLSPGFALPATEARPIATPGAPASVGHPALEAFRPENYLGVLFRTYLAYDLGEDLGLIDQHAAHERIRYETLKARAVARAEAGDVQDLLIPEVVRFDEPSANALEARLPLLTRLGFHCEIFGPGQLLVRSIPPEWGNLDLRTRLKNLVERLLALEPGDIQAGQRAETLFLDERLFEKLASEACRSSVRAGDRLDAWGARELVSRLGRCENPWNCPHGRPTTARVPKARFEEWFQRVV